MEQVLLAIWPDAAQALGVGRSTVYRLIREGKLYSVKIGRRHLVPASAIRELADKLGTAKQDGSTDAA